MNRSSDPDGSLRIMICDAQPLFSEVLAVALGLLPDLRILADRPTTLTEAVGVAEKHDPDIMLVDLWMEGTQDADFIKRLLPETGGRRIIFLSWLQNPDQIRRALDVGAAAVLPKSLRVSQVAEAIRRAAEGPVPLYTEELSRLLQTAESRSQRATQLAHQLAQLTPRERQVLVHLSYGEALPEVAKKLQIAPSTLQTHIRKILSKTGAQSQKEVIAMARYTGFIQD